MTRTEIKTVELNNKLAALARDYVNLMIEADMTTADMRDQRDKLERQFSDFVTRDIRTFAETGKYPQDEECEVVWRDCYNMRERVQYFRKHSHTVTDWRALMAAMRGDWGYAANMLHCPSDLIA